ncbi:tetratricopeptide repeat protein, partial [Paraglaciecola sp.]|uniref:tetratricopeptide repeat protein n=1 Tax=Paraglaciecola sp. TaxID=1920173 RepID=UPI003EF9D9AA
IHLPSLITYFALEHKVGAPEEAIKPIQEAYNLEPSNIKYALHYAKLLEVSKEYDQAISILKQITVSKTTPAPYWRLLIDIYLKQSKPQKVEDSLIQWTSTNPETGVAWRYLANLYESQGNVNKALTQVKSGIKFAKTERDNLLVLEIQHLIYLNKIKEGRESLNLLANQYEADNPVINLLEGQLFTLENKCKQALPLLENNYHFKPSVKVLKLVLNCNVKLNHIEEAVTFTKNHLKSFPKDNTARLYLAGLVMKNDKPYAEEIYKRILETDELNRIALNNLAAVMQEQGRSSEAVEITSNALKLAPDEPYLLEIHASALLKNNQTDEAISAYAKAYNASNKSKKYAQFYVDALRKTGNEAVANKISQDAGI